MDNARIMNTGKKIAVGMSGGIDSTMAAYILKTQGYEILGITMKIWDGSIACDAVRSGCYGPGEGSDIADAKKAAQRIGIEHHVIDLSGAYKNIVVDYFSDEYTDGRTPNPCVVCNSRMKFGLLQIKARSAGIMFDLFATGHYARVRYDAIRNRYLLLRGIDASKDQSYFLHRLTQDQISQTIFPLGDYRKEDVKALALDAGFDEYLNKKESQDFLEFDNYGMLLKEPPCPGNIVGPDGNIIGRHRGIAFYTVGQRRMLGLAGLKEPYYVLRIDAEKNEIVAGPKIGLMSDTLIAGDINWVIPFEEWPDGPVEAKIRSTAPAVLCRVYPKENGSIEVTFNTAQESITPGQSVVFYSDDIVLAGGKIA
ncbi:MAG: tRNA 2-thiouridine(34) synthase MnmA [Syntrophorhabdaceae bacterium]